MTTSLKFLQFKTASLLHKSSHYCKHSHWSQRYFLSISGVWKADKTKKCIELENYTQQILCHTSRKLVWRHDIWYDNTRFTAHKVYTMRQIYQKTTSKWVIISQNSQFNLKIDKSELTATLSWAYVNRSHTTKLSSCFKQTHAESKTFFPEKKGAKVSVWHVQIVIN